VPISFVEGSVDIWRLTWAKEAGAKVSTTRSASRPGIHRDLNVISSPFEVVEQNKIDWCYQQAIPLLLAQTPFGNFSEMTTGEFSGGKPSIGVHAISPFGKRLLDHLLLHCELSGYKIFFRPKPNPHVRIFFNVKR
jgi:hypothetical protein